MFLLFCLICDKSSLLASYSQDKDEVTLIIHNVGQGNFIELRDPSSRYSKMDNKPYYRIIVDMGSKAFNNEIHYGKWIAKEHNKEITQNRFKTRTHLNPSKLSPAIDHLSSPKSSGLSTKRTIFSLSETSKDKEKRVKYPTPLKRREATPEPSMNPISPKSDKPQDDNYKEVTQGTPKKNSKSITEAIRESLFPSNYNSISADVIIVTHPDEDHYGWLEQVFSGQNDYIGKIFLGGLPESYNQKFLSWLQTRYVTDTQIHFLGIRKDIIKNLLDIPFQGKEGHIFASEYHTEDLDSGEDKTFQLNIGDVKISLLSVNPTHWQGRKGVLRTSYHEDTNSDSLVVRILCKGISAILTGDATSLTTNRILDNYYDNAEKLKSDILVASHHGASSHGSNNSEWIKVVQPRYVVISNGYMYGHPRLLSYENFKLSKNLGVVDKFHKILLSEKILDDDEKKRNVYKIHNTTRAIFSTLTSGTIEIKLVSNQQEELKIGTQNNGIFNLCGIQRDDKIKDVEIFYYENDIDKLYISPPRIGDDIDKYELLVETEQPRKKQIRLSLPSPMTQKLLDKQKTDKGEEEQKLEKIQSTNVSEKEIKEEKKTKK
jgi:hypothetical protein